MIQNTDITHARILKELSGGDQEVSAEYWARFSASANQVAEYMATAFDKWRSLTEQFHMHEDAAYPIHAAYCAVFLHVQSTKLLLSGHNIASGNLLRQALEAMALSFLMSVPRLGVLARVKSDRYTSNNAVRDVVRHCDAIGIRKSAVATMKSAEGFYHQFSHFTKLTAAAVTSFPSYDLYIGASFDPEKTREYEKDVRNRVGLSKVFPNFMDVLRRNIAEWPCAKT